MTTFDACNSTRRPSGRRVELHALHRDDPAPESALPLARQLATGSADANAEHLEPALRPIGVAFVHRGPCLDQRCHRDGRHVLQLCGRLIGSPGMLGRIGIVGELWVSLCLVLPLFCPLVLPAFHAWILVAQRLCKETEASGLTLCFLASAPGGQIQRHPQSVSRLLC